jgi:hypothetical protein
VEQRLAFADVGQRRVGASYPFPKVPCGSFAKPPTGTDTFSGTALGPEWESIVDALSAECPPIAEGRLPRPSAERPVERRGVREAEAARDFDELDVPPP